MIERFTIARTKWLWRAAAVLAVATWVQATAVESRAFECQQAYPDCNGDEPVCVEGVCVDCEQDPGQCDTIPYLTDAFCSDDSGHCLECSDCSFQGYACPDDFGDCGYCDWSGYHCAQGWTCGEFDLCWLDPEPEECPLV